MTNVGTAINRMGQSLAYVCFPLCCRCFESQSADTQHSALSIQHSAFSTQPHTACVRCCGRDSTPQVCRASVRYRGRANVVLCHKQLPFGQPYDIHVRYDLANAFTPIAQLIRSMVFGVRFGVVCSVQRTACDVQSERPSLPWKQVVIYSQRKRCRPGCWHCMSTTWRKLSTSGPCPDSERFEMRRLLRHLPWSL